MTARMFLFTVLLIAGEAHAPAGEDVKVVKLDPSDFGRLGADELKAKYADKTVAVSGKAKRFLRDDKYGIDYYDVQVEKRGKSAVVVRVYFADPFDASTQLVREQVGQKKEPMVSVEGQCKATFSDKDGGGLLILRRCVLKD